FRIDARYSKPQIVPLTTIENLAHSSDIVLIGNDCRLCRRRRAIVIAIRQADALRDAYVVCENERVVSPTMPILERPTHDIVYAKFGLKPLVEEVLKTLSTDKRLVVKGNPELYSYEWDKDKHARFVLQVLHFRATTLIETLIDSGDSESSSSAQRYTISHLARKKMKESGLCSPRDSGRYHPLLLHLESGIQWIEEKQMAVIVLIEVVNGGSAEVEILSRDGDTPETIRSKIILSSGHVVLIYGPHGWRSRGKAVSFLFLYYDVVDCDAGASLGHEATIRN
ncbi:hypothetical protein Landi51_13828, partial [Colletotrichum acutatum]